jgi:hypothetical protein
MRDSMIWHCEERGEEIVMERHGLAGERLYLVIIG